MGSSRRQVVKGVVGGLGLTSVGATVAAQTGTAGQPGETLMLQTPDGHPLARYIFGPMPAGEKPPAVPFTNFTHPIWTPAGEVITDVGAADHPHHRGVFCAWIQIEGPDGGDWWGWGARAPKDGRRIINNSTTSRGSPPREVVAESVWLAAATPVLRERLTITAHHAGGHTVMDYEYRFQPASAGPVVIGRQPFGGFCYRARPRGEIILSDATGALSRPDSNPDKPALNWPARPWYDLSTRAVDGTLAGAAVMNHPSNPPSTWHVVRLPHMLNPCICRDGPVAIGANGLTLRYRVVAHDGPADGAALDALYDAFAKA